jgi:Xaa-Pro aminopeptidase
MSLIQPTRLERLSAIRTASNVDAFLLTSPSTVKCFSGYFYDFEIGPSPFHLLPAALLIAPEQGISMVIADNESFENQVSGSDISVVQYASYGYETAIDPAKEFMFKLLKELKQKNLGNAVIGIEQNALPFIVSKGILSEYPDVKFVDVSDEIANLKAVKDGDEIDNICKATALCDIGQSSVLRNAKVGMTELELFSIVQTEIEASVGMRVPIMLDLVSGARTKEGGGSPSNTIIQQGDLILSDLTPCLNGYWGDSCNTIAIGKPTDIQRDHFKMIQQALGSAIDFIRPGVKANAVDGLLRKHLKSAGNYGHHSGHGVGTTSHELPRIVPYNDILLEENMVIALEPAIYTDVYGIRLEHMVLVKENGCEILTKFSHQFEQE